MSGWPRRAELMKVTADQVASVRALLTRYIEGCRRKSDQLAPAARTLVVPSSPLCSKRRESRGSKEAHNPMWQPS